MTKGVGAAVNDREAAASPHRPSLHAGDLGQEPFFHGTLDARTSRYALAPGTLTAQTDSEPTTLAP